MQIIHNLGILSVKKSINDDAGFLLTNKNGSYCSFFAGPSSRNYGLFYFDEEGMDMHKFIDDIEIAGNKDVSALKNGFYFAERKKGDIIELYWMPKNFNSLAYELSAQKDINLVLDCKMSYDNREWGRNYEIFQEREFVVVKFTKKTDLREDSSNGNAEFALYLAIRSNNMQCSINDKWIERDYYSDRKRNSAPFKRHVYNALRLKGSKFVFSMSKSRNAAIKECDYVYSNLEQIKGMEKDNFFAVLRNNAVKKAITSGKLSNEIKVAYINAVNSLNNLSVSNKINSGILGGLPWFFQFWSRDSLVSLKALSNIDNELAKKIIFSYLGRINNDGRLSNLAGNSRLSGLGSADSAGWLFFRCNGVIEKINQNKAVINSIKGSINAIRQNKSPKSDRVKEYIKKCSLIIKRKENEMSQMIYDIESSLEKSINGLLKFHTKDSFESNGAKETWMDTDFGGDGRSGVRIEMQALRLKMYSLMHDLTLSHKYKILENTLKIKLRQKFWNSKILADGLDDTTIRPNMFIASYAYPKFLSSKEWETCFENSLKNLWLEWGGLSTIDKNNKLFTDTNTGENNQSYHRGDSWFWLNNLAAIELNKINSKKFKNQIQKIISASTEDILWKGCIGCASELSSAKELSSHGCFSQAWSNAMYVEMVDELINE